MVEKIGAYLCNGCGLKERLNMDQLATIAHKEGRCAVVKQHDMLCNKAGVAMIQDDIDNNLVDGIVIGACSKRSKTTTFIFDKVVMARSSLREGVIWSRPDTSEAQETTDEMAADYVRMACAEVKQMTLPKVSGSGEQGINKHALVVGGGFSGMSAALGLAKAGYKSTIIEKSPQLGGMVANLYKRLPVIASNMTLQDNDIAKLIKEVEECANINLILGATVAKTSGAPGRFVVDVLVKNAINTTQIQVGSIIQATGFVDYNANNLTEFSYSKSTDIITQKELELLAKSSDGNMRRPSDAKQINSVVFIQCAGQRSEKAEHLSYCSGFCCNVSIKQARYFKEQNPNIHTEIIYSDLITAGSVGENLYRSGQEAAVSFTKGIVSAVDTDLKVTFLDLILNEERFIKADLVVLATGMVPNSGINIEANEEEMQVTAGVSPLVSSIPVESILKLDYRQGSDLPQLINGFADSHFICFPYETQRTGIYAAGPVRRPMDAQQAEEDAFGAAMKAISAIENSALGMAQSPRSGDLSFPSFDKAGCTKCNRCTVECPFGAIDEDNEGYPVYNESRCRRCGTCMGACPVRVISFENYNIQSVSQQIKAVDMPDEFDEKPRVAVFVCENDALPALDMAAQNGVHYSEFARVFPVRCLGSMSKDWVVDALNSGYDGIVMMGCKKGAQYQCHMIKGSQLAQERMSKIDDTLASLSLESERVAVHEVAITDIKKAPQLINAMVQTIERIGMNPFKF